METKTFIDICKETVAKELDERARKLNHLEDFEGDLVTPDDIFLVWYSKVLQNNKAIVGSYRYAKGMLFEVTYNGDKHEIYIDSYSKEFNKAIKL